MTTYSSPVPRIGGGREIYPNAVLDLIDAAPDNSWIKLNTNEYQDVWPPVDLRAWYGGGPGNPHNVIDAWSSFAWDKRRSRLVLWGGGHANYNGDETYIWDAYSREWSLAYHTVERTGMPDALRWSRWRTSPVSAHTYDNQLYLAGLDRFLTWGGAQAGSGGYWEVFDETDGTALRNMPGYLLDLSLAGQGFVGGRTGDNAKRGEYAGVDLFGARPWTPLDYVGLEVSGYELFNERNTINGVGDSILVDGVDVVFQTIRAGTARSLRRITMPSLDPATHTIVGCGAGGSISSAFGAGCYVPDRDIFVLTGKGSSVLYFWRDVGVSTSTSNPSFAVDVTALIGPGVSAVEDALAADAGGSFRFGLDYDPVNQKLIAWREEVRGRVFAFTPPEGDPVSNTGWHVEVIADVTTGDYPTAQNPSKGTMGKWKYAPDLRCFIGLQDTYRGNVWAFRPANWIDPRGAA